MWWTLSAHMHVHACRAYLQVFPDFIGRGEVFWKRFSTDLNKVVATPANHHWIVAPAYMHTQYASYMHAPLYLSHPMQIATNPWNAPMNRNPGPNSLPNDSTVDFRVNLPTPYSNRIRGMDHNQRKANQTRRNASAPAESNHVCRKCNNIQIGHFYLLQLHCWPQFWGTSRYCQYPLPSPAWLTGRHRRRRMYPTNNIIIVVVFYNELKFNH